MAPRAGPPCPDRVRSRAMSHRHDPSQTAGSTPATAAASDLAATQKCVIVLDEALPVGLLANAAAVLATAVGRRRPEVVGADLPDASGRIHPGLVQLTLPILRASRAELADVAQRAHQLPGDAVLVIGFSEAAQRARTYEGYAAALAATPTADLQYLGLALCGDRAAVARLTGALRLLR